MKKRILLITALAPLMMPAVAFADSATYYPNMDGYMVVTNATWSGARGATTADTRDQASTVGYEYSYNDGSSYSISRGVFCFDTSSLPDSATVTAVTLDVTTDAKYDQDADGQDYMVLTDANPADTNDLSTADFDAVADVAMSDTVTISSLSIGAAHTFTGNASGIANVSTTARTCFALREGHDVENAAIGTSKLNELDSRMSEYTGTASDPLLTVTYTVASSSSSSSSSSVSSSALGGSGSLIIYHNACNTFAGTGANATCTEWDTAIEIPAVKFFVDAMGLIAMQAIALCIVLFVSYRMLWAVIRWSLKLLTKH